MASIDVKNLTKHYGDIQANQELTFSVKEGEVFGYLGPNGAGKTTTIRTLLGFQAPTDGTATVLGADIRNENELMEAKRNIGYLPSNPAFDETSTGKEILDLHASIKGDSRREDLLEMFDPPLSRKIREYSTGNIQKLGLVQAFMHDPDLVIMDEPTSGLDPLMQQRFNEFVREEKSKGLTVFLSSHILSEVRRVCDRVGIIRQGRLVTTEDIESLLHRSGKFVRLRALNSISSDEFDIEGVHDVEITNVEADGELELGFESESGKEMIEEGQTISEVTFTYTGDINSLLDRLSETILLDLDVEEAPLEEVFMRFYGESEQEGVQEGERTVKGGELDV